MTPNDHCFLIGMPLCYPVPLSGGWNFLLPSMTKIWQMWLDDTSNIRLWKEDNSVLWSLLDYCLREGNFHAVKLCWGEAHLRKVRGLLTVTSEAPDTDSPPPSWTFGWDQSPNWHESIATWWESLSLRHQALTWQDSVSTETMI